MKRNAAWFSLFIAAGLWVGCTALTDFDLKDSATDTSIDSVDDTQIDSSTDPVPDTPTDTSEDPIEDPVEEDAATDVVDEDIVTDVVDEDVVADIVDEDVAADVVEEDAPLDLVEEDVAGEEAPGCGNDHIDSGEVCDGTDTTGSGDCEGHGFTGGTIGCLGDCSGYVYTSCTGGCGNDLVEGSEECDGTDMGVDPECDDHGYTSGIVTCSACAYVLTGCTSLCGDGITNTDETCDDYNADACGTCNAACTIAVTALAATGTIVAVAKTALQDAETFTVSDGINAVIFELDVAGDGVTSGNVAVDVSTVATAEEVRDTIVTAINGVGAGLLVTAAANATVEVLDLTNDRPTLLGNVAILETVTDSGFAATGMSGGAAGDCAASTGCSTDDDCSSASCTTHVCD